MGAGLVGVATPELFWRFVRLSAKPTCTGVSVE